MRRRDEQLPREVGRAAEGFLVEEVAPPADGLPDREARSRDVEILPDRQPPAPRVAAPQENAADHATVDGEPTLPEREDFTGELAVVVEVEQHVVQARTHEAAEQGQLGRLEQALGVDAPP